MTASFKKLKELLSLESHKSNKQTVWQGKTARKEHPTETPDIVSDLLKDEVFVFGSNLEGAHGGGAAYDAMRNFGAEWGVGVGMTGQCYAIPTMHGGVEEIRPYVDDFIAFAKLHPEKYFLVTRIGCGIAGFKDSEIAPLFRETLNMENVCLPHSFRFCLARIDCREHKAQQ